MSLLCDSEKASTTVTLVLEGEDLKAARIVSAHQDRGDEAGIRRIVSEYLRRTAKEFEPQSFVGQQ